MIQSMLKSYQIDIDLNTLVNRVDCVLTSSLKVGRILLRVNWNKEVTNIYNTLQGIIISSA